eukprot:Nitzschia sp. Nitz4//scaffold21_size171442//60100//61685//NITZ4_002159-RA/size171442-augustus-gene-0.181-mRNA-1//1//CDS//3329542405//3692//frame0
MVKSINDNDNNTGTGSGNLIQRRKVDSVPEGDENIDTSQPFNVPEMSEGAPVDMPAFLVPSNGILTVDKKDNPLLESLSKPNPNANPTPGYRRAQSDITWGPDHPSFYNSVDRTSMDTSIDLNAASTRTQVTRVRPSMIRNQSASHPANTTTKVQIGMQELVNVLRNDQSTQHVDMEQLQRIREMYGKFAEGSHFSFNYITLLLVAGALAGLGLVSNSSATILASMLVSPIMGPVVGIAYAATIHDWRLCKQALKTELISLLVCVLMGAVIACCTGWTDLAHNWPTDEMVARARLQNLLVGCPVAFLSGLGVAVGLLDDQTSSLVGVAISASLLPPAVNSGIAWVAYWFARQNWLGDESLYDGPLTHPPTQKDFRQGGGMSLALTISNIVLVIISSMLMFRLKERLPIKKKVFWHDLGTARKISQNLAVLLEDDEEQEKLLGTDDEK